MLEILGKLGFDWQVALVQLVSFLIVFLLIRHLFFKPIKETLAKRKETIDSGLENAEKAQAALVEAESQKKHLLEDAYQESQEIVQDAQEKRQSIVAKASDEAEQEASKIREAGLRDVASMKEKLDEDLKSRSIELVMLGLEKTLKKTMTKEHNDALVKEMIDNA